MPKETMPAKPIAQLHKLSEYQLLHRKGVLKKRHTFPKSELGPLENVCPSQYNGFNTESCHSVVQYIKYWIIFTLDKCTENPIA